MRKYEMRLGKVEILASDAATDNFEYTVNATTAGLYWTEWDQSRDVYIVYDEAWFAKPWNNYDFIKITSPALICLKRNKITGIKIETEQTGDPKNCHYHILEEYIGFTDIYKVCTRCGHKHYHKDIDYKKIK